MLDFIQQLVSGIALGCVYGLIALGFVLIWFGIRRELRAENPEQYPPKVKKTRIWDEEDE